MAYVFISRFNVLYALGGVYVVRIALTNEDTPRAGTERSDRRASVAPTAPLSRAGVKSEILCGTVVYVDLLCHAQTQCKEACLNSRYVLLAPDLF